MSGFMTKSVEYWCSALSLAVLMLVATACGSSETHLFPKMDLGGVHVLPPAGEDACDLPFESVAEAVDQGRYSFAVGTIKSVEAVTDSFADFDGRRLRDTCDGQVEPAVRITVALKDAGWDGYETETLTVGLFARAFVLADAEPYLHHRSGALAWTDGNRYFPEGARIGMLGAFMEDGTYNVMMDNFFAVADDGEIFDARPPGRCLKDTLNGKNIHTLIEGERRARDGARLFIQPPLETPLYSVCYEE